RARDATPPAAMRAARRSGRWSTCWTDSAPASASPQPAISSAKACRATAPTSDRRHRAATAPKQSAQPSTVGAASVVIVAYGHPLAAQGALGKRGDVAPVDADLLSQERLQPRSSRTAGIEHPPRPRRAYGSADRRRSD